MNYQMLVLDLDGTLTNSQKEIPPATRNALIEIQEEGKKIVLASGRPTYGIVPLAEELELARFGGYILSFNGARITQCSNMSVAYDKVLPPSAIRPIYDIVREFPGVDILTYENENILSGLTRNEYTEKEAFINKMPIVQIEDLPSYVTFPINKLLVTGDPEVLPAIEDALKKKFRKSLSIYPSCPFFLEIAPQNIDKANSLQKLLNSIGLRADSMICCGDGLNDLSMIEYAGLGVAMENAHPLIKETADFITRSNDEDGILFVINLFMRD